MTRDGADGPVLVAVEEPDRVQQLVRTAGDLARPGAGEVRLVTVVAKPYESPFGVFDDETIRREYADESRTLLRRATTPEGVAVDRDLVVARSIARGILAAVEETDPAALVVGWQGQTRRTGVTLGSTLDALIERAACDLYVERIGREANGVESVLLPVAGGPHVATAATAAAAIAVRNDARVVVLSVATPDIDRDEATAFAVEARETLAAVPGPEPSAETAVRDAASATDAIVAAAAEHDVLVPGVTRRSSIRRRIAGSVAKRVVDRTDRTVILARSGDAIGGRIARLRRILGRARS